MAKIDINEHIIFKKYPALLDILISDRSSGKTLVWGTNNYSNHGIGYYEDNHIFSKLITGYNHSLLKPRINKSQKEQKKRSRDMAEVFTPSWVCNKQNNLVDESWFGKKGAFNEEKDDNTWIATKKVNFPDGKTWQEYVDLERLEITCGEAPYLVSRYDATSGDYIDVGNRIGLLDRKLRVINENITDKNEWWKWVVIAYQRTYGYDFQGDNVILARENLLFDFIDNYIFKFNEEPSIDYITEIAKILSWNIFQMDGLKYVIPLSCHKEKKRNLQMSLFDFDEEGIYHSPEEDDEECPGCVKGNNRLHNGIYVKIKDWKKNKTVRFIDLIGGIS